MLKIAIDGFKSNGKLISRTLLQPKKKCMRNRHALFFELLL